VKTSAAAGATRGHDGTCVFITSPRFVAQAQPRRLDVLQNRELGHVTFLEEDQHEKESIHVFIEDPRYETEVSYA
jgi:hypothetical protein